MSLQKKLKPIISSLKEKEIIYLLELFQKSQSHALQKMIRKISFNCYQSTIQYCSNTINGYGKNQNQAFASSILNLIDYLLVDQNSCQILCECVIHLQNLNFEQTTETTPFYQKILKTQPDIPNDRKNYTHSHKAMETVLLPKQNTLKKMKSSAQEQPQSLNIDNIQLKQMLKDKYMILHKTSSKSQLIKPKETNYNSELQIVLANIKQIQLRIKTAEQQNIYLKNILKQKQSCEQKYENKKIEKSTFHTQSSKVLSQINSKLNTVSNQVVKDQKVRTYSLCNNVSNSYGKTQISSKLKIPKLNLQILPNYHGKNNNKSLNQSLLESYEKNVKTNI